jgi:hypothetical protein
MTDPPGAAAREKLIEWRARLIDKLDRQIEGGDLALLGDIQMAIMAIDAAADLVLCAGPLALLGNEGARSIMASAFASGAIASILTAR